MLQPHFNCGQVSRGGAAVVNYSVRVKYDKSRLHSMQELIMQGMQQKWERSCFRYKKNTWHVESNYILQPPKYLIIVVNQFRYIDKNFTKDRCSIPMDTTVVLGLHKFSLQANIDHHGPSMYSGHYTASINCWEKKNILLQRQQNYWVWNDWYQNSSTAYVVMLWIDYLMVFGLEQEDGSFNCSHGAGTSSLSH